MSDDFASPASSTPVQPRPSWADTLRVYLEPATLRMLALGFSAGLPLLLVLGTLSFRLREAGIDRTTIGYLSWVGLAYGFKWCWAPLVDRLPLPGLTNTLGRRRGWLLLSQAAIMAGLAGMALADPRDALGPIVWCALAVAFGSATQDIALDAFRIESADTQRQAALAATYQTGYRLAMIWAGAGVLWIAARAEVATAGNYQHAAWQTAYLVMAASMLVGVLTVLLSREPVRAALPPRAQRGRMAAGRAGGAVCGLHPPLPLAGRADPEPDRRVPHQRCRDGHHGQPVLCGHGLHQGRGRRRDQGVWRDHDPGWRLHWRRAVHAVRRDARADAGRRAERGHQPVVRLAGRARPRRAGTHLGRLGRQPVVGHCVGGVHRLPVVADQCELFSHAVRAVQLHDAAAAQMAGGVFRASMWTCMGMWSFSTRPRCWVCRCWCWCGWRRAQAPGLHPSPEGIHFVHCTLSMRQSRFRSACNIKSWCDPAQ